jgi:hypothetical protein
MFQIVQSFSSSPDCEDLIGLSWKVRLLQLQNNTQFRMFRESDTWFCMDFWLIVIVFGIEKNMFSMYKCSILVFGYKSSYKEATLSIPVWRTRGQFHTTICLKIKICLQVHHSCFTKLSYFMVISQGPVSQNYLMTKICLKIKKKMS